MSVTDLSDSQSHRISFKEIACGARMAGAGFTLDPHFPISAISATTTLYRSIHPISVSRRVQIVGGGQRAGDNTSDIMYRHVSLYRLYRCIALYSRSHALTVRPEVRANIHLISDVSNDTSIPY